MMPINMEGYASKDFNLTLTRYQQSLVELTFNSKPLIDDLTRTAGVCGPVGAQVVKLIQTRIMKVRPEWKLPSLYLLDSIMKNLKGVYLEYISEVIVGVFCHCFEKLTEPDSRKSLYKLRTTWTPFLPKRKLAAIDRHVHALDSHWPMPVVDSDPASSTIFVNPKFIEGSAVDSKSVSVSKKKQVSPSVPRLTTVCPPKGKPQPPLIKDEPTVSSISSGRLPRSHSPSLRSSLTSCLVTSCSPPPCAKRIKVESDKECNDARDKVESNEPNGGPQDRVQPIKSSQLQLDDIPPELLHKHQENIMNKIERQIAAGDLAPEQRTILKNQLDKLYQLQKLKDCKSETSTSHLQEPATSCSAVAGVNTSGGHLSAQHLQQQTVAHHSHPPPHHSSHPPPHHSSHPPPHHSSHPPPHHSSHPPPHHSSHPPPHHSSHPPPHHSSHPPPHHSSHPLHPHPPHQPPVQHSRPLLHPSLNNFSQSPACRGGAGLAPRPLPPHVQGAWPPQNIEPQKGLAVPGVQNPTGLAVPGVQNPTGLAVPGVQNPIGLAVPGVQNPTGLAVPGSHTPAVNELFQSLVNAGMIDERRPTHPVPNLSLTPATLKQRYGSLILLLHEGKPCSSCGLRFASDASDQYRVHLNWHYQRNRQEEGQTRTSQNWFIHPDDWLNYEELEGDSREVSLEHVGERDSPASLPAAVTEGDKEIEGRGSKPAKSCPVQPGEDNEVCSVCHEQLEQFWEEEEEVWHFRDAVRSQSDGKLHHTCCDEGMS